MRFFPCMNSRALHEPQCSRSGRMGFSVWPPLGRAAGGGILRGARSRAATAAGGTATHPAGAPPSCRWHGAGAHLRCTGSCAAHRLTRDTPPLLRAAPTAGCTAASARLQVHGILRGATAAGGTAAGAWDHARRIASRAATAARSASSRGHPSSKRNLCPCQRVRMCSMVANFLQRWQYG